MFLSAYPSDQILSQEAHLALSKQRAASMFQGFLTAIRSSVKREQAALTDFANRNLEFTRMVTGLRGSEVKSALTSQCNQDARLLIN